MIIYRAAILSFLLTFSCLSSIQAKEFILEEVPVLYKGRIRPLDAMARLWLNDIYHRETIKSSQYNQFHVPGPSALTLLWKIQFSGYQNWIDIPLFWIYSLELKQLLELPVKNNYFSYYELFHSISNNEKTNLGMVKELILYHFLQNYFDSSNRSGKQQFELRQLSPGLQIALKKDQLVVEAAPKNFPWHFLSPGDILAKDVDQILPSYLKQHRALNQEILTVLQEMHQFLSLKTPYATGEKEYETTVQQMIKEKMIPSHIEELLEQEYPLHRRLSEAGDLFRVLPAKNEEWYSLQALTLKTYSAEKNDLLPIHNFTLYPDQQFDQIRQTYFKLINDYDDSTYKQELAHLLIENYALIANTPMQQALEKSIVYPSIQKLKLEYWYYQLPLTETTIALYAIASIFLILGFNQKKRRLTNIGTFFALVAFAFNTLILMIRCFVLGRPPVSNMFETIIYVPWVALLVSLLLTYRLKNSFILLGASLVALIMLVLLKITGLGSSLENVQAVLDSQFWLIIHVLMIVGSYGVFALGGILGQIYLFKYIIHEHETYDMQEIGKAILQALYIGVALLIPGTILGGVWAAQSWGRFWDWDPKESWAFISSCVYLIFIHAYRYNHIRFFGLAMGSIVGLLAISFTWYGVNYILGTGLHSYGFGSGGEIYYYLFLLIELLFLCFVGIFHFKLTKVHDSR